MIPPNTRSGGDTAQGGEKQPKLRSTCDACITAKIRCSRDTPQCFRCQIYKINCVYSLSRKMGRPRKQRTPPQSEQDNQPRAVDRSSASREDTKPAKRSVKGHAKRSSVTKELSSGASIPSPMSQESTAAAANVIPVPGAVDASSLILDGSLSSYADYSLGTMGPTSQGELPQITQSPTIADYSLDTSFTTLLQATTLENPPNLPSSVPLSTAATVAPSGSQSPAWNYGMNPNVFNLDQDPSLFNNFVDLEPVDFSVSSSSGHSPDMDPRMSVDSMMPETDLPYLINTAETTPSNGSNTPYTFSSRCNCYKSTLHLLLSLDDIAPTTASITLDTALRVDSEVLTHNEKVLKCAVCGGKHSTQLLLQAILLDRVLGLLEIGMLEATSTRNAASQSFSNLKGPSDTANNPSNLSNLMRFGGSGTSQHENMVAAGLAEFEIAEVKNSFTKQLVKMHLLNMVSGLENLQKATQSVTPDSSARMAETMLAELGVRLVNVIGRVELWNI